MGNTNGTGGSDTRDYSLYAAYLADLGRIGERHQTLRQFYLSVISALFVLLSMAKDDGALVEIKYGAQVVVALVGIAISVLWCFHMKTFSNLYRVKKMILSQLEKGWPVQPFKQETAELSRAGYIHLTEVDQWVAAVFVALFVALLVVKWF